MNGITSKRAAGMTLLLAGPTLLLAALLAACGSSGHAAASSSSGTETFRALLTSSDLSSSKIKIPLTASGLFADAGNVSPGARAGDMTFKLHNGELMVSGTKGTTKHSVSKKCASVYVNTAAYKVIGGTGRYAGATGNGSLTVSSTSTFPAKSNGKCDLSSGKVTHFREMLTAHGPMDLQK